MVDQASEETGLHVFLGIAAVGLINGGSVGLILLLVNIGANAFGELLIVVFAIGLFQLLYVLPWWLSLRNKNRPMFRRGIVIGAALTALLNGTCFGLLINMLGGW